MDQQNLFVKMGLQAWEINTKRATALFSGFTDEGLFQEIAPGKNRVIYLLGHLTAVHDRMLPLLGLGERLYPQLDEAFISNPDEEIKLKDDAFVTKVIEALTRAVIRYKTDYETRIGVIRPPAPTPTASTDKKAGT